MRLYNSAELSLDCAAVLRTALKEDVFVADNEGATFKIVPCERKAGKSPFEGIKGIKANISTEQLIEILHEGRAGI